MRAIAFRNDDGNAVALCVITTKKGQEPFIRPIRVEGPSIFDTMASDLFLVVEVEAIGGGGDDVDPTSQLYMSHHHGGFTFANAVSESASAIACKALTDRTCLKAILDKANTIWQEDKEANMRTGRFH